MHLSLRTTSSRGFTLIELLVVIAIIGILSTVVLAALYIARLKGADAAIKEDMHTIRNAMETYYDNNLNYGTVQADSPSPRSTLPANGTIFNTDPNISQALQSALNQGGYIRYAVGTGASTYAVAVKLKADSTNWRCIDSANNIKLETDAYMSGAGAKIGASGAAAVCP